jgi:aryl-alcohol dehydrogenase-like predicted oxidoreductase
MDCRILRGFVYESFWFGGWVLSVTGKTIPGTSSLQHLEENIKAADIALSNQEWVETEAEAS